MTDQVFPGADRRTPSQAQYFSWINNTNEGSTAEQTRINLAFFQWLRDEYGMQLDIYAFDAGNIDGKHFYGSMNSDRFRRQFPEGFEPIRQQAAEQGCRLGLWGGPDGFGDTPEEEAARIEMMVHLCRDCGVALFKFDGVCGVLRPEKHDAFVRMMRRCRAHCPDLIVLNHRLDLGPEGLKHATTSLWHGGETYIDVHLRNRRTGTHCRVGALERGLVDGLERLLEDHGVCLSSCLDYWEDDLILQAFGRCLILAPEIYGNPWLLRDDEFPRLARIYNLHRRYREILVDGMLLPAERYGPSAVSRGDTTTRFLALRNLEWEPAEYPVVLDESIGLAPAETVEVRLFHPVEQLLGRYLWGTTVPVHVLPFRACLVMAATSDCPELAVEGCAYEVVCDAPARPAAIKLLGMPGSQATIALRTGGRDFTKAQLDGESVPALLAGEIVDIRFPGTPLRHPWHRKLADLLPSDVPADAPALYEATCFAADNNALEVRELERSGPTGFPAVQAARDAFFQQACFVERGTWDRYLFDGSPDTGFQVNRRWTGRVAEFCGACLRVDFGAQIRLDQCVIRIANAYQLQPLKVQEAVWGDVSADLKTWHRVQFEGDVSLSADIPSGLAVRYLRLPECPDRVVAVEGYHQGRQVDASAWRASNLFRPYRRQAASHAWTATFTIDEVPANAYLALAVNGQHGLERAWGALRIDGEPVGAPRRAPSYPANTWEVPVSRCDGNCTFLFPMTPEMAGKPIDAVLLLLTGGSAELQPEVWLTAYPLPFETHELVLR